MSASLGSTSGGLGWFWWGVESSAADLATNLARDEALLLWCEGVGRAAALRFWEQPSLGVVLGASGRLHREVFVDVCRGAGVAIGRRCSGGGTVVLGPGSMNITVVLPIDYDPRLSAVDTAQRYVLERSIPPGLPVEIKGHGDWTVGGRKCAGSAQRRLKGHVMVHATVLYDFDLGAISALLNTPEREPAYRGGRSHAEFLVNLGASGEVLVEGISECWRPAAGWSGAPGVSEFVTEELVRGKYGLSSWTERL